MFNKMVVLFCLIWTSCTYGAEIRAKHQRNLAIVLDLPQQEDSFSAMALELYYLLQSTKAAILINNAVWENVKKAFLSNAEHSFSMNLEQLIAGWHFYKKDGFLLLIPETTPEKDPYTLGFNLDQFELIQPGVMLDTSEVATIKSKAAAIKKAFHKSYYAYFPYALEMRSQKFIKVLQELLIPKKQLNSIEWNIYFTGHGSSLYQTVGITEEAFKRVLHLLEHHINTHSFYYSSCFSGGKIAEVLFKDQKFSYPIFSEGLDAMTFVKADANYSTLFELLEQVDTTNFQTIKNLALSFAGNYSINNMLAVRLPYAVQFNYIPVDGFIYPITHNATQDDVIANTSSFYYLLETAHCAFNINLHHNLYHHIISGMRGNSCHYIKSVTLHSNISSGENELFPGFPRESKLLPTFFGLELIEKFKEMSMFAPKKIILFDSVVLKQAEHSEVFPPCINNVVLLVNDDISYWPKLKINSHESKLHMVNACNLFFELEGSYYLMRFYNDNDYEISSLTHKQAQKYLELFNKNKELVLKGEQPIWKIAKLFNSPLIRKLYPWIITTGVAASLYLRIKAELNSAFRKK